MKRYDTVTTAAAAALAGVHPNTVRLYEAQGFLPPVPRNSSGYRQFDELLIGHVKVVRWLSRITWMSGPIRSHALDSLRHAAERNFPAAISSAAAARAALREEQRRAREAVSILEQWRQGMAGSGLELPAPFTIRDAAAEAGVTPDQIRNWEKNGLFRLKRDAGSRYRRFTQSDIGLFKVVRVCCRAGFSLMAIRRILAAIRSGSSRAAESVLDEPAPYERELYSDCYPTDAWLSTLSAAEQALRNALKELRRLA
jgi:DNA-binding transcriptional MerR regulator